MKPHCNRNCKCKSEQFSSELVWIRADLDQVQQKYRPLAMHPKSDNYHDSNGLSAFLTDT